MKKRCSPSSTVNVLFINHSDETFTPTHSGAIATHIWECCRAAKAEGDAPTVLSRRSEAAPYEGVETIFVDYPAVPASGIAHKFFRAERRLTGWRHLRQKKYAERVARTIREKGLDEVAMILHNDPEMAVLLREKFPEAFIIHHFHNQIDSAPRFRKGLKRAANVVTGVSNFTSRWVEETYGLGKNKVETIYNGVDTDRFSPLERKLNGCPVLNFVGRTGIEKAPDLLLKAAVKLAEKKSTKFSVQILGSNHWGKFELDGYQKELQELCGVLEKAGVAVYRPGHVPRAALPEQLRRAHINVVPSRWDEPFALAIVEGMACGLATVVSRTGGAPEVVGEAGLLFERDSVEGLAGHLEQLILNKNLLADYGLRARERARHFTWDKTWSGFRAVI